MNKKKPTKTPDFAIILKDLNSNKRKYSVDAKTYRNFHKEYSKLHSTTIIFYTSAGKKVRGILDAIVETKILTINN